MREAEPDFKNLIAVEEICITGLNLVVEGPGAVVGSTIQEQRWNRSVDTGTFPVADTLKAKSRTDETVERVSIV